MTLCCCSSGLTYIVKDRNFVLEDSQSGREDFLKTLRSQHFLTSKGPKASLSKFNALSEAHRLLDEHWSSQCFVMTATCLLQGWGQLWCPDDCVAALMEGTSTKAQAKASAKAALEKMRGKAVNSLRSMTKYMNDPEVKCQSRLIACVLAPEAEAASRMLVEMRDASTTLQYFVSWSHWGWLETAEKHLGLLEDLRSKEPSAGRVEYDTATTQKLFSFLKAMLKYRGGSNLWHAWGPGAVAGLLSTDETQVRSSLTSSMLWLRFEEQAAWQLRACLRTPWSRMLSSGMSSICCALRTGEKFRKPRRTS